MTDPWRTLLRGLLVLAMAALGLTEARAFLDTLGATAERRADVARALRAALTPLTGRATAALAASGPQAGVLLVRRALPLSLASEVELRDASGTLLAAEPRAVPVEHRLDPRQREELAAGRLLILGPVPGPEPRLLAYAWLAAPRGPAVLRVGSPAAELVEELRRRRQMLVSHGMALVVLFLAGVLVLLPGRDGPAASGRSSGLDAYAEAVERLQRTGRESSQRHAAELRRLEESARDLQAMARAGELTAGMVHEVRNSLATIQGYARLAEQARAPAEARESAERIREECETLEALVRRFMEFAQREELRPAPIELSQLLRRVLAREARGQPVAEVRLQAPAEVTLSADETLLERAFENLVRNALQAAGAGGRVVVGLDAEAGGACVTVADDGPGLPPEARRRLRPFFTTKPGGLGLGLAIALKIIGLHGGELALIDGHPRGLVARVRLPEKPPEAEPSVTDSSNANEDAI